MPNNPELEGIIATLRGEVAAAANAPIVQVRPIYLRIIIDALAETERRLTESEAKLAASEKEMSRLNLYLRQDEIANFAETGALKQQLADSQAIGPCGKHPKSALELVEHVSDDEIGTRISEECTTCREVSEAVRAGKAVGMGVKMDIEQLRLAKLDAKILQEGYELAKLVQTLDGYLGGDVPQFRLLMERSRIIINDVEGRAGLPQNPAVSEAVRGEREKA